MTADEFDALEEDLQELQAETAEALAEDLGGEPEDYYVRGGAAGDGRE